MGRRCMWGVLVLVLAWVGGCASGPPVAPSCGRSAIAINGVPVAGATDGR